MAYIEAHQSLLTHRKTLRLGRLLGMDRFCVCGRLMALWCWALDNAPDGVVAVEDADILADVVGWEREPSELCNALVAAGFFELAEGFFVLHDWYVYAGKLIEKRQANAERMRAARARASGTAWSASAPDDARAVNVQRTCDERAGATVPNRSLADLSPEIPDGISAPALAAEPPSPPSAPVVASAGDPDASSVAGHGVDAEAASQPSPKPPKLKPIYGEDSVPMQLARNLAAGIHRNKPDAKLPRDGFQEWAREFDLMLRVDHRPREKIEAVIAYAMASTFWRRVIFSARKIREKFDVIDAQRQEDSGRGQHARGQSGLRGTGGRASGNAIGFGERPDITSRAYYEAAARRLGQGGGREADGDDGSVAPTPVRVAGG